VTFHESHLRDDGSVFPPVTPDPPLPPGQEEIQVPDLIPEVDPENPDGGDSPKGNEPPD